MLEDGVAIEEMNTWNEFVDLVHRKINYDQYIWRGQRSEDWLLESTFERNIPDYLYTDKEIGKIRREHLIGFKLASRGRRGINSSLPANDYEWWALGQHHGLATPLLDWSLSPFVAAFFAFEEEKEGKFRRTIWALSTISIQKKNQEFDDDSIYPRDGIRLVMPRTDENPRLISQAGIFTISPSGIDIEQWIRKQYKGDKHIRLRKVTIPNHERETVLKALNRMNINHATLFPDLIGASKYCNLSLSVEHYQSRAYRLSEE